MSLKIINKILIDSRVWWFISFMTMLWYLSPLLFNNGVFYVPVFDNLDSTVVWYKILAESGMIFADNNAIVPNMMNGLPRSSYPGEFNVILWLYYFFDPKIAFIINEVTIHIVAFVSMFVFLKRYVVKERSYYQDVPVFVGALYFAFIPYWSGAGLTIASLPIVTYALLNIKNEKSTKWDWILLIVLPLYTSFIFLYMFYIIMAGIYLIWDSIQSKKINKYLLFALVLMGTMFLLSEYRLVQTMFFDSEFISHRTEFNIFFQNSLLDSYRTMLLFFIDGHLSHVPGLQVNYILPVIIIGALLGFVKRKFSSKESMILWIIIIVSFVSTIWNQVFTSFYTIPILFLAFSMMIIFNTKSKKIALLIILQLLLIFIAVSMGYKGFSAITDYIPLFKSLNMTRIAFVEPFILAMALVMSTMIIIRKLHYSVIFLVVLICVQFIFSINSSFYQTEKRTGYSSFDEYYAPNAFDKITIKLDTYKKENKVVSYGLEPAISLYNGFYTIDGYSVNYPLEYKYKFRKIIEEYLDDNKNQVIRKKYDNWGSKLYIFSVPRLIDFYSKDILIESPRISTKALCKIGTDYMLSAYKFKKNNKALTLIDMSITTDSVWNIYVYKLECER